MKTIHPAIAEHVMEENEKLRGLLCEIAEGCTRRDMPSEQTVTKWADRIDAARSQQADPTDTFTSVDMATAAAQGFRDGQSAVESAPAQTVPVAQALRKMMTELEEIALIQPDCSKTELILKAVEALATRAPQTEQQPVAWVHPNYLRDNALGFEASQCRLSPLQVPLYTIPIAQTEQQPEQDALSAVTAERDRLRAEVNSLLDAITAMAEARDRIRAEVEGLRKALEQFADDGNWCYDTCNISRDVAKDALVAKDETP